VSVISVVSIICFLGCVADSFNDTTIYQAHFCWTANSASEALQTLNETTVAADT